MRVQVVDNYRGKEQDRWYQTEFIQTEGVGGRANISSTEDSLISYEPRHVALCSDSIRRSFVRCVDRKHNILFD